MRNEDSLCLEAIDGEDVMVRATMDGHVLLGEGRAKVREVMFVESQNSLLFPGQEVNGIYLKDRAGVPALARMLEACGVAHNIRPVSSSSSPVSPVYSGTFPSGEVVCVGDTVEVRGQLYKVVKEMSCWNRYELKDAEGSTVWRDGKAIVRKLKRTCIGWDERMSLHGVLDEQLDLLQAPERPDRCETVWCALLEAGLVQQCDVFPVPEAERDVVCTVHTPEHFDRVMCCSPEALKDENNSAQTLLTPASPTAALLAVGCAVEAVRQVLVEGHPNAMALVRPPGHHAEADHGMGFCLFNNVAIAARWALTHGGVSRVLVVDWDVHHGNGIQNAFYKDPAVLYVSLHVRAGGRFYPGTGQVNETGVGTGAGHNVNVAWRETGTGDAEYRAAFAEVVMPVAKAFDPELVIVSSGFDAAAGDPLGACCVTPECFAWMTRELQRLAEGKMVVVLEGGYSLAALSTCSSAVLEQLISYLPSTPLPLSPPSLDPTIPVSAAATLFDTARALVPYWPCLGAAMERLKELETACRAREDEEYMSARRQTYSSN